jgi:uncharacterized phage-associated protein
MLVPVMICLETGTGGHQPTRIPLANMIKFSFNLLKTLQASKVLLQKHAGGRMEPVRLLKLLYIVDRELLAETGKTLTGDSAVAMKYGPVLVNVRQLINGNGADASLWNSVIHKEGHEVAIASDSQLGVGKLAKSELRKLDEVSARYSETISEDLIEITHDFAEWINAFDANNPESSNPMEWEKALEDQGAADLIEEIESDLQEHILFQQALQVAAC